MLQITNENVDQVLDTEKPVLIDFFAEWCAPCKMMMPYLEELELESEDVLICKADVDVNDVLCSKFRITNVPTVILFHKGKEVTRAVGVTDKRDLLEMTSRV